MQLKIQAFDRIKREKILEKAHHNVQILPSELVPYDLSTDSLQHHCLTFDNGKTERKRSALKPVVLECQELIKELFGFPYSTLVAQGRMAEALLSKLLVKNGCVIPTNTAFPTTRLHQELNGGKSVEVVVSEAYESKNSFPFKANVDLAKLGDVIKYYSPRWIPFISLETSANGIGGQPFSMENLAAVAQLAKKYGIKIFLDACRILEQAYQIRTHDPKFKEVAIWKIVRQICSYADGMTMSLTKDFPTPIGGVVAFRDETLYQESFDFVMAMGNGLSHEAKEKICGALRFANNDTSYIEDRMHLTKLFHEGLCSVGIPVFQPHGGHAVLLDLNLLLPHLSTTKFPAESLNRELFLEFGGRGAPHILSSRQQELGMNLFRLAIPIMKLTEVDVQKLVESLRRWYPRKNQMKGLKSVFIPAGLSGEFRAWYSPC